MTLYEQFLSLPIDRESLGLEPHDRDTTHFCTPVGAEILGWAGVDGVHYCTVPSIGEIIFCVTPMDGPPYVRPIAEDFDMLLHLLLACGSMDAISQAYMMDEARFYQFVAENPPTPAQQKALNAIEQQLVPTPWDDPYAYIRALQENFDYASIPYSDTYYDLTGEPPPSSWAVTWDGSLYGQKGTPGEEIAMDKTFIWGNARWHIPALYRFPEGFILDFCMEVDPAPVRAFIEKWDLLHEEQHTYTSAQRRQIETEHPLHFDFSAELQLDGERIPYRSSSSQSWIPPECLGISIPYEREQKELLDHYHLDPTSCWSFHRVKFPYENGGDLHGLTLHLSVRPTSLPIGTIDTPKPGEILHFTHPLTGQDTAVTILEVEQQTLDPHRFPDPDAEYPTHFTAMTFTLDPDCSHKDFRLQDCGEGDSVRRKNTDGATAVGIIGGTSAPMLMIRQSKERPYIHTTCSALRFDAEHPIQWEAVFYEKLMEDMEVELF